MLVDGSERVSLDSKIMLCIHFNIYPNFYDI